MAHNFNTIEGTEVFNVNDPVQGSHAITLEDVKDYVINPLDVYGDALISGLTIGVGSDDSNTIVGFQALVYNSTGYDNVAIGRQALFSNTTGNNNTASGYQALYSNTTGNYNTASGRQALFSNTTGNSNTASGRQALYFNTTGNYNTASGRQALFSNTTGNSNTASGYQALFSNTTGNSNTASGFQALFSNTTGNSNTASGFQALFSNTTGNGNTASGYFALFSNTTGSQNVGSGLNSGRFIADGSTANAITDNSVYIGYDSRALANNQTNQIVIGHTAIGLGSNTAVLGNASIVTTALRGSVGVNTTSPNASAQLQIDSTTKGFLPPRMTAAQATAIASPAEGLLVYVTNTDVTFTAKGWWGYDGTNWIQF